MPRTRLAGEFRKVRTGTKADIHFCRLPVRPQGQLGPTDTGLLAESPGQNTRNTVTTGLSGPAVHVSDRFINSHRKASSPRPTTYETHTVASQKQLEVPESLEKVAKRSNVFTGQPLHPIKHALQIFTDASKEGWGAHLKEHTARWSWSLPEIKLLINYLELKAVFLAFPRPLHRQDSTCGN